MNFFKIKSGVIGVVYQKIIKPIAFKFDPEKVHDAFTNMGNFLGKSSFLKNITSWLFSYEDSVLEQVILGIKFKNPIGLAAGFDKDAYLAAITGSVGFGFEEIGSVTGEKCPGNPKPRLWRLLESKSLVVYYGLKNDGCEVVAKRLKYIPKDLIWGISIAKTNSACTVKEEDGIKDYLKAYEVFKNADLGDYYTINISCPNAFGGEPFVEYQKLSRLLQGLKIKEETKPVFIKLPPDISFEELDKIIDISRENKIKGFICTNLTKSRSNPKIVEKIVPEKGGLSGKPVEELSNKMIEYIYKKTGKEFVIIGCGGVFTADDAYEKIKRGASLIQMITGMVYGGPQTIGQINSGLAELLQKDGYQNISEAVGAYWR